jgi:rfaE bifunctional protein kinase chain/domain
LLTPKKNNFSFYSNAKIITPNLNELERATKVKLQDYDAIKKACNEILSKTNLEYIIAKMGEKGMMIVGVNNFLKIINPHFVKNPDVTGAGDTVIAAFSLAYAKFEKVELAAKVANAAASIAVSKKGTATVKIEELESLITK